MLFRLIFFGVAAYWCAKLIKNLMNSSVPPKEGGQRMSDHNRSRNFSEEDIEDADFEELDE
jgi:hypothetical protein